MTRARQDALFDPAKSDGTVGPVYQGVCAQIRALFPRDDADAQKRKLSLLGTIAQARSIAASIDRVSGHAGPYQAAGMQLSAMHEQLAQRLAELRPDDNSDPFERWMQELDQLEGGVPDGAAAIPHTPQP